MQWSHQFRLLTYNSHLIAATGHLYFNMDAYFERILAEGKQPSLLQALTSGIPDVELLNKRQFHQLFYSKIDSLPVYVRCPTYLTIRMDQFSAKM